MCGSQSLAGSGPKAQEKLPCRGGHQVHDPATGLLLAGQPSRPFTGLRLIPCCPVTQGRSADAIQTMGRTRKDKALKVGQADQTPQKSFRPFLRDRATDHRHLSWSHAQPLWDEWRGRASGTSDSHRVETDLLSGDKTISKSTVTWSHPGKGEPQSSEPLSTAVCQGNWQVPHEAASLWGGRVCCTW